MKYVVLLGDGMADYPTVKLGGKTPLQCAFTPHLDEIAACGTLGLVDTIPAGFPPGSDVANLSVLGYDPVQLYTGRGPLEAASMGVNLGPNDVAYRCNLVTIGNKNTADAFMDDFTAGHISTAESSEIIQDINKQLGSSQYQFYPGVGYRHLFVWRNSLAAPNTTPPHDITGKAIAPYLPQGDNADEINLVMQKASEMLNNHRTNIARLNNGKKAANSIWLWGQGRKPKIIPLASKYGLQGGMISAVDLLNGIGVIAGLKIIRVPGATGYIDTNYEGKAKAALDALNFMDFIFVHLEAPDEMGHEGNAEGKIEAIENFDEKIVGTILNNIRSFGDFRVLVLSDHPTPLDLKTHSGDPSPFAVLSSRKEENKESGDPYNEITAKKSGILISPGYLLMDKFIQDWRVFVGS
ncbi:MAG: cofactor-independent phosphoglycerate mutase [Deltaproteobacteria bacterium HGW-Deltaproteobacteria-12]|jgi:2,3-bisphosphoglycerate-independent phosphoglycerate mutase|nr:MAG: cofactor-independent phosphoglycerate mutase [Deltaproteobacteria bacterium HGW-Deltaproteobacteria-12]